MEEHKNIISEELFEILTDIQGVISVTLVGSLCDTNNTSAISDIDTILICDKLTENLYNQCTSRVQALDGADLGYPGHTVYVNSTFGPLKYDNEDSIVVHLMIYDVEGHRNHVLKSPFTCYDWERSKLHIGPSLKQIYPVLKLQPRDFLQARRGLQDYLEDLSKGVLSYRCYVFENGQVKEALKHKQLDSRHQGEYSYHIVRNLVSNYIKLIEKKNVYLDNKQLLNGWKRYLPACAYFIPYYERLQKIKLQKGKVSPADTIAKVKEFVLAFESEFQESWRDCSKFQFLRHCSTELNNGSFLGQGRDPSIRKDVEINPLKHPVDYIYCSPLKRTVETARCMANKATITEDERLLEMNYGRAEGLNYRQLKERFPEIVEGWANGRDMNFPDGENTEAVLKRLRSFLDEKRNTKGDSLIVTHNVILRCLVGYLYDILPEKWYKLSIPHLKQMEVLQKKGKYYPNFSTDIKSTLTDSLVEIYRENHD